jgi:SAM-dependent methyltransferase
MTSKNKMLNKPYWEENINHYSGFYDKISEENIIAPSLISYLYKKLIFPIEKQFINRRFNLVNEYIDRNVHEGMTVADIGCGNGIYTKKMASKGAKVYAFDYAERALSLVKRNLSHQEAKLVEINNLDITEQNIPSVDLAISIGVLTCIDEYDKYFNNILPYTNKFFFNFLSASHLLNIFRKSLPIFDVRKLSYHYVEDIAEELESSKFQMIRKIRLATGFIIESEKAT